MRKADKVRRGIEQAKKNAEEARRTGLEAQKRDREIRARAAAKKKATQEEEHDRKLEELRVASLQAAGYTASEVDTLFDVSL